jgi:hypothetical protein
LVARFLQLTHANRSTTSHTFFPSRLFYFAEQVRLGGLARNLPGIVGGCGGKYGGGGDVSHGVACILGVVVAVLSAGSSMKLISGWRRCCAARCCRFGVVAADASGDASTSNGGAVRRLPPRRDWWRRKRGKPARLPHKNLPLKENSSSLL